jgi:hypothetical protein
MGMLSDQLPSSLDLSEAHSGGVYLMRMFLLAVTGALLFIQCAQYRIQVKTLPLTRDADVVVDGQAISQTDKTGSAHIILEKVSMAHNPVLTMPGQCD